MCHHTDDVVALYTGTSQGTGDSAKINIQNRYMLIFRLFEDKMIQQAPDELYTLHTDNIGGR